MYNEKLRYCRETAQQHWIGKGKGGPYSSRSVGGVLISLS